MKLLLHACCGPCLLEPYDALAAEHDVTVVYANPNIHPAEEYARRLATLREYADAHRIRVIELPYAPEAWETAVAPYPEDRERRCAACFRLRLGTAAEVAVAEGFEAVATTLTVSPYQDQDAVRSAGEESCSDAGVEYLDADFRDLYPEATRRSRELGMYRQNFCGCRFSRVEADTEREARRAARRDAR